LLEQLTSEQLSEWEAYDRLEPVGEIRGDVRNALLCMLVANLAQSVWGKKGRHRMFELQDFLPRWDESVGEKERTPQSVEEMKEVLKTIARTVGKRKK